MNFLYFWREMPKEITGQMEADILLVPMLSCSKQITKITMPLVFDDLQNSGEGL